MTHFSVGGEEVAYAGAMLALNADDPKSPWARDATADLRMMAEVLANTDLWQAGRRNTLTLMQPWCRAVSSEAVAGNLRWSKRCGMQKTGKIVSLRC